MGNIAMSSNNNKYPAPAVMGDESIMSKKAHGTSAVPVQENLRWKVDQDTADRICNFNRHYAEHSGYFQSVSDFLKEAKNLPATDEITFYDSKDTKRDPVILDIRPFPIRAYDETSFKIRMFIVL